MVLMTKCCILGLTVPLMTMPDEFRTSQSTFDASLYPSLTCDGSPVEDADGDHPEEGHHGCLTADVWHQMMLAPDGRLADPDHLRQVGRVEGRMTKLSGHLRGI